MLATKSASGNELLSVAEAKEIILSAARTRAARVVPLTETLDCVLAQEVVSPINLPSWDNSSVDGYAVCSSDVAACGREQPGFICVWWSLCRQARRRVGDWKPQTCARKVFTGAPIPDGADAVVMQEDTRPHHEGYIAVDESGWESGENIRGWLMMWRKERSFSVPRRAARAAQLRSGGGGRPWRNSRYIPASRVGVLVTGAEIVEPGKPLRAGQIYDANSYTLCACW